HGGARGGWGRRGRSHADGRWRIRCRALRDDMVREQPCGTDGDAGRCCEAEEVPAADATVSERVDEIAPVRGCHGVTSVDGRSRHPVRGSGWWVVRAIPKVTLQYHSGGAGAAGRVVTDASVAWQHLRCPAAGRWWCAVVTPRCRGAPGSTRRARRTRS